MKKFYDILSKNINALKEKRYPIDFSIKEKHLICRQEDVILWPNNFKIDKVYRFEGESNPCDQPLLYHVPRLSLALKNYW